MSVKRFIGKDAHSAMQQVRKEFGSDAVIIANRETSTGVVIVASDSFDDILDSSDVKDYIANSDQTSLLVTDDLLDDSPTGKPPGRKSSSKKTTSRSNTKTRGTSRSADVQQEITELRNMLEGLARAGSISTIKNGAHIGLSGKLLAAGFGAELVRGIMDAVGSIKKTDAALQKANSILEKQLPLDSGNYLSEGGVVFFHGPSGAGKTTVLCKLAAEFLAQESASKLALINADSNTIGNSGLLSAVGTLLGVPIHSVHSEAELNHATRQLRRKHLILVDTGAFDAETLRNPEELPGINQKSKKNEHCLVLPANLQASTLDHVFGCLSESLVQSLILTRVDETIQLGTALDSLLRSSMKLRYWSNSAKLHHPLSPANATELIARTLKAQNAAPRTIINKMPTTSNSGSTTTEEMLSSIPFG